MENVDAERLIELGIEMYREANLREAVEFLRQGLDRKDDAWTARLYLAMAYYRLGRITLARAEFKRILDECTDKELRLKAASALTATNPEIKRIDF